MLDVARLLVIGAGSVVWLWFTYWSEWICRKCSSKYDVLDDDKKLIVRNSLACSIYSLLAATFALYTLWFDNAIHSDHIWGYSALSENCMIFVVSYIVAETYIMTKLPRGIKFVFHHHFVSLVMILRNMACEVYTFFGIFRLICEISSPLVCIRTFLHILEVGSETSRITIGALSILVFFACRILPLPYYYIQLYRLFNAKDGPSLPVTDLVMLLVTGGLLDFFNLVWFSIMIQAVYNVFLKKMKYHGYVK